LILRPRGPRSGPGYSVPVRHHLLGPIRPTRGHIAISPHGGLYAVSSLCGSASATREWFRAFAARSLLTCRPLRPRGVRTSSCPVHRCRHGLRHSSTGSALPMFPQSVSRGAPISWLLWFAFAAACQVARSPDSEIVPMLEAAPGIRAVAIFEEICRRHPELRPGVRLRMSSRFRPTTYSSLWLSTKDRC